MKKKIKNLSTALKKKVERKKSPSSPTPRSAQKVVRVHALGETLELKTKEQHAKEKIDYNKHWKGMPEFKQENLAPVKSIIVNFASKEDMHKFSKLVGQLITAKTRFIWYPENKEELYTDKRWSDKTPIYEETVPKKKIVMRRIK